MPRSSTVSVLKPRPSAVPKISVKFRVSYTRDIDGTSDQSTFFTVDRATLHRLVPLLLWDTTVDSIYIDDFKGEVVSDLVRK